MRFYSYSLRLIRFQEGRGLRVGRDVLLRGIVVGASRSSFRNTNSRETNVSRIDLPLHKLERRGILLSRLNR